MENPSAEEITVSTSYPHKNMNVGSTCAESFPDGWGFYNGAGVMVCGDTAKEAHTWKNSTSTKERGGFIGPLFDREKPH